MIRLLLQRVGVSRFNRPRVVICVPSAITEVERRAVTEAARRAGAADAQLHRAADGRGDRRRPADRRAGRQHGHRHRRRHHRDRGHLARRHRRARGGAGRLVRHRRRASRPTSAASTASPSASAPPRRSRWRSARPSRRDDEVKAEVRGRDLMSGLPEDGDPVARGGARRRSTSRSAPIVDSVIRCLGAGAARAGAGLHRPRACTSSAAAACCAASTSASREETEVPVHLVDAPLECVVLGAGHCIEPTTR